MARKGFLKIAMSKTSKSGRPFVSLLILDHPDDEDGQWMSLFDSWYFGGEPDKPSPYDIRRYADRDDPQPVVYEAEKRGEFVNCLRIRPESERWELPEGFAAVKGKAKSKLIEPEGPYEGPLDDIGKAIAMIKDGLDLLKEALER